MPPREPRNNKPKPQDSRVLEQVGHLIDRRLPDGHGFALLTFPLGAAVDPRCRYIGKGDRDDILKMMQFWLDAQRSGKIAFGEHSTAPEPTQWHTAKPTEPGFYLVRFKVGDPQLIRLDPGSNRDLMVLSQTDAGWFNNCRTVDTFEDTTIFLGPIPQPWLTQPAPEIPDPKEPMEGDDWKIGDKAPPVNVITPQFGESVPPIEPSDRAAFFERIEAHHADAIAENADLLLHGYPHDGGIIDRACLARLLRAAFNGGVASQALNPITL